MANRTKVTPQKKKAFLESLSSCGNVTLAARESGITRQEWYRERADDEKFAATWEGAVQLGVEALEDEARRRAVDGVDEPVFYQGKVSGHVRKYSDTLLIFLLKAHKPEKYRERHEITGRNGGPIQTEDLTELDTDERARRIASFLELAAKQKS